MLHVLTFPRSDIPIFFMASLGVSFKPVRLAVPVTRQGVLSQTNLTPPHVPRAWRSWHFYHVCI